MEKKPKEFALEYAGFWVRLGAGIIDLLILGFIAWLSICVFDATVILMIVTPIVSVAYFTGFCAWQGQTFGKMVMGLKVIHTDSSPVTLACAFLRCLGYIVSAMFFFIGFIWIAFDSRKQGLHDKIADTYVVKLPVRQVVFTESCTRGEVG